MTRRFDEDKNFELFSICSKMVTEEVKWGAWCFTYNLGDGQKNFSCDNLVVPETKENTGLRFESMSSVA